jgi:hypothetical protein
MPPYDEDYEDEETAGDEELGDELEEMLEDLGISGEEELGRRFKRRMRRTMKKWSKVSRRRIRGVGGTLSRQLPFLMSVGSGIADGAATTLSGTCDRRSVLSALYVEGNSALGVRVSGVHVTGLTVNGRNAVVGAGSIPSRMAFGDFAQAADGDDQWQLGVIDQGGTASLDLTNDSGAVADLYSGFRALTTD